MYQGKSGPHLNTKRRNPLSLSPEAFFWACKLIAESRILTLLYLEKYG